MALHVGVGRGPGHMLRVGGVSWTPASLGASLLGWWDAEDASTITQSGGSVSAWKDKVGAYTLTQTTGSQKPIYSASGFNSRPVVTFDGVDDYLDLASVPFPTGANSAEVWALVDQTALTGDTTQRIAFTYGTTGSKSRGIRRGVTTGVNRAQGFLGDGTSTATNENGSVDFSGRHVVRHIVDGVNQETDVDGTANTPAAKTPNVGAVTTRMGAGVGTPANFWQGGVNSLIVTPLLTADQATQLLAYLKARGGIS